MFCIDPNSAVICTLSFALKLSDVLKVAPGPEPTTAPIVGRTNTFGSGAAWACASEGASTRASPTPIANCFIRCPSR
jgi:hypothetical protein